MVARVGGWGGMGGREDTGLDEAGSFWAELAAGRSTLKQD